MKIWKRVGQKNIYQRVSTKSEQGDEQKRGRCQASTRGWEQGGICHKTNCYGANEPQTTASKQATYPVKWRVMKILISELFGVFFIKGHFIHSFPCFYNPSS